jgi:hypothetical protein
MNITPLNYSLAGTLNHLVLKTRIDHYYLESDLKKFLQQNQVVFFEWASELVSGRFPPFENLRDRNPAAPV